MALDPVNDFRINQYALDVEWLQQASRYQMYAARKADAEREKDRAKASLDLTMAQIDTDIRKDPAKYGVPKANNDSVAALVVQQDGYKKALSDYIDAKYNREVLDGQVEAMGHRKSALENLVRLKIAGYFSDPNIPKEEQQKGTEAAVARSTDELNNTEPAVGLCGVSRRRVRAAE